MQKLFQRSALMVATLLATTSLSAAGDVLILVHGLTSAAEYTEPMAQRFKKLYPGLYIKSIELKGKTFGDLNKMADLMKEQLDADPNIDLENSSLHVIGHSLGGLIARLCIQRYGLVVQSFCPIGSPQRGVYGWPGSLDENIDERRLDPSLSIVARCVLRIAAKLIRESEANIDRVFNWRILQKHFSIAQIWRDPADLEAFLEKSRVLAYLNNEVPHVHSADFKQTVMNIGNLVAIGSSGDDFITPSESVLYGYTHAGSEDSSNQGTLEETYPVDKDPLGLVQLLKWGRLKRIMIDDEKLNHGSFWQSQKMFDKLNEHLPFRTIPALAQTPDVPALPAPKGGNGPCCTMV